MNNLLIISYSPLHKDPRILRQIEALKKDFKIQTLGFTNPNINNVVFFQTQFQTFKNLKEKILYLLRLFLFQYKKILKQRLDIKNIETFNIVEPKIIIANDWDGLFTANILKRKKKWNSKVYFDAHEYFFNYRPGIKFKILNQPLINYVLREYRNSFEVMSTVCESLAKKYEKKLKKPKNSIKIITNAPFYNKNITPFNNIDNKITLIHHGVAIPQRELEKMIDMMDFLPEEKYELSFMLVKTDIIYYNSLINRAKKHNNIHFLDTVPFEKISETINKYDIGLFILSNKIESYKYALPNKFFEYIQARLCIAVGDSYEMKKYIRKYKLGISAESNKPEDLAKEIIKINKDDIILFKNNSNKVAKELSAEENIRKIQEIIKEL